MIEYVAVSVQGTQRKTNEDLIMVNDCFVSKGPCCGKSEKTLFAMICDGVGSTDDGRRAAEIAAAGFLGFDVSLASPITIIRQIAEINDAILLERKTSLRSMASTIAGVMLYDNVFMTFNLGDTRIYQHKKGSLLLKSKDHVLSGVGAKGKNDEDKDKNGILSGYLGDQSPTAPSIRRGLIEDRDTGFIVCSDGVYKAIKDSDILAVMDTDRTIDQKARAILDTSLQNGSTDDMSLLVIRRTV